MPLEGTQPLIYHRYSPPNLARRGVGRGQLAGVRGRFFSGDPPIAAQLQRVALGPRVG